MDSEFKSQIRASTISNLVEKVQKRGYGQYISKVNLVRVRAFTNQTVTFDFPVTALIGPNGGGKTTILGSVATAYAHVRPRQFFAKSGKYDQSMSNWRMEYEIIDRSISKTDSIKRTAAFHAQKWSRDALKRDMAVFGVSRTVPANERKELQRCASGTFKVDPSRISDLENSVAEAVAKILGKNVSKYTHMRVNSAGTISLLTGNTEGGTQYSEFHFGAGESSIIRMVMKIESLPDNSLILIEEIENGLHPVATIRMVEYLIDVAERKSSQAIFTTHSNDALKPLPPRAIWASVGGTVFQGKLDIAALRAIVGQIDAKLAIFCEDDFASHWIRAMLRTRPEIAQDAIEIYAMAGDGSAVKINAHHNKDPSSKFPSVCFIDGDSKQTASITEKIFRLPGLAPEAKVFDAVMAISKECGGILAVRLLQPFSKADAVISKANEIRLTNHDSHTLFSQLGLALGLIPASTVRDAFVSTWAEYCPEDVQLTLDSIKSLLPKELQESSVGRVSAA